MNPVFSAARFLFKIVQLGELEVLKVSWHLLFFSPLAPSLQSADAEPLLQELACSEKHFNVYSAVSVAVLLTFGITPKKLITDKSLQSNLITSLSTLSYK